MVSGKAIIKNNAGIHVRPSGVIYTAVKDYQGTIRLSGNGMDVDLGGLMGLIAMGLCRGNGVKIEVTGPDEKQKCEQLVELFERVYDFSGREQG